MFEASSDIFNYCRDSLCEGGVKGVAIKTPGNVLRNLRETLEKNWRGGEGKVRGCWWRRSQTLDTVLRRRETWWDINIILIVQKCTMCQQVPIPQLTSPPTQIVKNMWCPENMAEIWLKYDCDSAGRRRAVHLLWFRSLLVLLFITSGVAFYHPWCCFLLLLVLIFYHPLLGPRGPLRTPLVSVPLLSVVRNKNSRNLSLFLFLQTLSSSNLSHSTQYTEHWTGSIRGPF